MKVYIGRMTRDRNEKDPMRMALKQIAGTLAGSELMESAEDAEVALVASSGEALRILKDDENVTVGVFTLPGENQEVNGVRSLQKAFPGRVDLCTLLDPEPGSDAKMVVFYLLEKGGYTDENTARG